jgi:hypothetical protein
MYPPTNDNHTTTTPTRSSDAKPRAPSTLQIGEVFVPRRVLHSGVFVPDGLLASRLVSNGAKLLWARLARYAGTKGLCFPLLSTLAADLGFSERQVQRYLAELVSGGFLRARQRGYNKSNFYEFLWHPALASTGVVATGTEQTEQQKHSPPQEDLSLCRAVESPFRLFQPAEPQELVATEPGDSTTTLASCSATELASCVSTTDVSSWKNDFKKRFELQAKPPRIVEVVEVPAGSACPSPEKAKRKPLTPEESAVFGVLADFQAQLQIAGTILPSTVRRMMASIPTARLLEALRFVADKLYRRRRNEPSYRSRVGWGFVFRILEQDFVVPSRQTPPSEKSPVARLANSTGTAPPLVVPQRHRPGSPPQRGGLLSAGEILADLGLAENTRSRPRD